MCAYKSGAPLDALTGSERLRRGSPLALRVDAYSCAPKWTFGTACVCVEGADLFNGGSSAAVTAANNSAHAGA